MNEFIWAQTLQNTLSMMHMFNTANVVVHSTHRNVISFELRDHITINKSKVGSVVSFGKITLKAEYVGVEIRDEMFSVMQKLAENKNKFMENYLKRKQTK